MNKADFTQHVVRMLPRLTPLPEDYQSVIVDALTDDRSSPDSAVLVGYIMFPQHTGLDMDVLSRLNHMWKSVAPSVLLVVTIRNIRLTDSGVETIEPRLAVEVQF